MILATALVGEAAVWLFPKKLEAMAAFVFGVLAAGGYAIERVGDDAIIDALKNRAKVAEGTLSKLTSDRVILDKPFEAFVENTFA